MNTTYTELNDHIEFLKEEIDKLLDRLAEMLGSEEPWELHSERYAECEAKLVEMTEELDGATEYAKRLAAY